MATNAAKRRAMGRHLRRRSYAWAMLGLLLSASVQAGMIDREGVAPQELCGLCHSLDGISRMPKFPKLAGQKAAYIKKQFLDFHAGRRTNDGGQMSGITREIDTAQIDDVAHYFSQLPAPQAMSLPDDPLAQRRFQQGATLFLKGRQGLAACATCHGVQGRHVILAPWLHAQHDAYLIKQLADFKHGRRHNDPDAVMRSIAAKLTDEDIEALARYLASTTLRQTSTKRD